MDLNVRYPENIDHFLFFSVDIVGSTAFKSSKEGDAMGLGGIPVWMSETDRIFRSIQEMLRDQIEDDSQHASQSGLLLPTPKFWKTRGDELLLICRIETCRELALVISSFLVVAEKQRQELKRGKNTPDLSLKSAIWMVRTPFPNCVNSVEIDSDKEAFSKFSYLSHVREKLMYTPHLTDINGPEVDAGFRLSSLANADQTPISVDVAWLLTFVDHEVEFEHELHYLGRIALRGVKYGQNDPHVVIRTFVDSDEFKIRSETQNFESRMTGAQNVSADTLKIEDIREFCHSWMLENNFPPIGLSDGTVATPVKQHQSRKRDELWRKLRKDLQSFLDAQDDAARSDEASGYASGDLDEHGLSGGSARAPQEAKPGIVHQAVASAQMTVYAAGGAVVASSKDLEDRLARIEPVP